MNRAALERVDEVGQPETRSAEGQRPIGNDQDLGRAFLEQRQYQVVCRKAARWAQALIRRRRRVTPSTLAMPREHQACGSRSTLCWSRRSQSEISRQREIMDRRPLNFGRTRKSTGLSQEQFQIGGSDIALHETSSQARLDPVVDRYSVLRKAFTACIAVG
jgi:hypothetical protein